MTCVGVNATKMIKACFLSIFMESMFNNMVYGNLNYFEIKRKMTNEILGSRLRESPQWKKKSRRKF